MACASELVKLLSSVSQQRYCCTGSLQSWFQPRLIPCTITMTSGVLHFTSFSVAQHHHLGRLRHSHVMLMAS